MAAIVSVHTTSYGPYGDRAAIENVRRAGIEWIELPIHTAGVDFPRQDQPLVTTGSTLADLKHVERLLEQHGVRVASCNIVSGNPLDPEIVSLIKRKLDLASHFGVTVVVGDAGEAECGPLAPRAERQLAERTTLRAVPDHIHRESRQTLHRHLTKIGDYAAQLGVTYCLDTQPGICRHHHGMLETMAAVDHPHVKLNFDTADVLYYNENVVGEIALAKVCHLVRHVHLKDSSGEFGRWHFPALGYGGAVDFVRVWELLRVCGFRGPYSIEIGGIAGEGELTLEQYHQRVADSVQHLRQCGYFD